MIKLIRVYLPFFNCVKLRPQVNGYNKDNSDNGAIIGNVAFLYKGTSLFFVNPFKKRL